jgi:hypothetical protein
MDAIMCVLVAIIVLMIMVVIYHFYKHDYEDEYSAPTAPTLTAAQTAMGAKLAPMLANKLGSQISANPKSQAAMSQAILSIPGINDIVAACLPLATNPINAAQYPGIKHVPGLDGCVNTIASQDPKKTYAALVNIANLQMGAMGMTAPPKACVNKHLMHQFLKDGKILGDYIAQMLVGVPSC